MRMPFSAQKRQTLRRPAPRRPRGPRSSRPRPRPRPPPPPPLRPLDRPGMLTLYVLLGVADFGVGPESIVVLFLDVGLGGFDFLTWERAGGRGILLLAHRHEAQHRVRQLEI